MTRRRGGAYCPALRPEIRIGTDARHYVVTHEVAHHIRCRLWPGVAGHAPEFVGVFIDLLAAEYGLDQAMLRDLAHRHRVRTISQEAAEAFHAGVAEQLAVRHLAAAHARIGTPEADRDEPSRALQRVIQASAR